MSARAPARAVRRRVRPRPPPAWAAPRAALPGARGKYQYHGVLAVCSNRVPPVSFTFRGVPKAALPLQAHGSAAARARSTAVKTAHFRGSSAPTASTSPMVLISAPAAPPVVGHSGVPMSAAAMGSSAGRKYSFKKRGGLLFGRHHWQSTLCFRRNISGPTGRPGACRWKYPRCPCRSPQWQCSSAPAWKYPF